MRWIKNFDVDQTLAKAMRQMCPWKKYFRVWIQYFTSNTKGSSSMGAPGAHRLAHNRRCLIISDSCTGLWGTSYDRNACRFSLQLSAVN